MKRLVVFLLSAMLMLSVVACGDKSSSQISSTTEPKATVADNTTITGETTAVTTTATSATAIIKTTTKKATTTKATQPQTNEPQMTFPPAKPLEPPVAVEKKKIGDTMVSPISNKTYQLKFIEEFEGTELNTSRWRYALSNSGGAEQQKNLKENVVIADGKLTISAKKEKTASTNSFGKETYYTGSKIDSMNQVYYKYGRFEALIKLPRGSGMWPAFWTMGNFKGWPWGGEIDILEMAGSDHGYASALHWCEPGIPSSQAYGSGHRTVGGGIFGLPNSKEKLNDKFHVIGMEWTPTSISFYCDGRKFGEKSITQSDMREAFHQEHFILLNFALGGMGGKIDDSALPQKMVVDWVKVWQVK